MMTMRTIARLAVSGILLASLAAVCGGCGELPYPPAAEPPPIAEPVDPTPVTSREGLTSPDASAPSSNLAAAQRTDGAPK
jgi:hypothetical protein